MFFPRKKWKRKKKYENEEVHFEAHYKCALTFLAHIILYYAQYDNKSTEGLTQKMHISIICSQFIECIHKKKKRIFFVGSFEFGFLFRLFFMLIIIRLLIVFFFLVLTVCVVFRVIFFIHIYTETQDHSDFDWCVQ